MKLQSREEERRRSGIDIREREGDKDAEKKEKNHKHECAHLDRGWLNISQIRLIKSGKPSVRKASSNIYLQKGYDKRSQREVGGFLELGVKFFDG